MSGSRHGDIIVRSIAVSEWCVVLVEFPSLMIFNELLVMKFSTHRPLASVVVLPQSWWYALKSPMSTRVVEVDVRVQSSFVQ